MARLQSTDFETLLQAIRILGELRSVEDFPLAAMRAARALIPGISYAYTEVDLDWSRSIGAMDPVDSAPSAALIAVMDSYVSQHPLITTFAQSSTAGVQLISDHLSERDYHRLELYGEFYRLRDTEDQMASQLHTASSRVVGLVVNRDRRTFTERERALFTLLSPHLLQSYQNALALALLDDVPAAGGHQAVWLTRDGQIAHATRGAQALFDAYFGPRRAPGTGLPECLVEWLACQRAHSDREDPRVFPPFHVSGLESRLTIRFMVGLGSSSDLLLLNEQRSTLPDFAFAALGLSPRQTEVVRWVVEGKSSAEIGVLLGMKSRTVEKHLENIYERLGVTSRAGLVARALQSLGDRDDSRTSVRSLAMR